VTDEVELSLPAKPELLSLARLTVAALASRADFDYEEIEDLRLAIDELCSPLVGQTGRPGQLRLRYLWDRSWLEVSCTIDDEPTNSPPGRSVSSTRPEHDEGSLGELGSFGSLGADAGEQELSDRILDALVDEHGSKTDGSTVQVWLRKRRPGTGP